MSISIHFTTTDRKGSSTVGFTTVDSTAAALKSFRYDTLIRIASKVGLTMPNILSSSVPGRGPVMSSLGKLESGFEFFRSMYVVAEPELENFFQRTRSIVLAVFKYSSYSSSLAWTSVLAMSTSLTRSSDVSVNSPKGLTVKRLLLISTRLLPWLSSRRSRNELGFIGGTVRYSHQRERYKPRRGAYSHTNKTTAASDGVSVETFDLRLEIGKTVQRE
ncbi:hypothetical protein GQ600_3486 [Phytophthora cactorum]|nr:hypothetical protein GQ600_3486 [Phytophthora cactorum]